MATAPSYVGTPKSPQVQISTANANRDGTGAMGTLAAAVGSAFRVDDIYVTAQGTTTAGMIRFYKYDGSTTRLLFEVAVTAVTPSATAPVWWMPLYNLGITLEVGHELRVSTEKAETFNVHVTRGGLA